MCCTSSFSHPTSDPLLFTPYPKWVDVLIALGEQQMQMAASGGKHSTKNVNNNQVSPPKDIPTR
jgi:hypothetical protein